MKTLAFLCLMIGTVAYGAEKFPESCSPSGVVSGIAVGSQGTVNFRLKGAESETFKILSDKGGQQARFLSLLIASNNTGKNICVTVENGEVISMNYDVKSEHRASGKKQTINAGAGAGF